MELADYSLADLTTKRDRYNSNHPDNQIEKLSDEDKLRIIKEIADGVAYLHSKGFIHRNLRVWFFYVLLF